MRVLPRSLRARLTATFAVASALIVFASGFGLYTNITRKASQRVDHQLKDRTRAIINSIAKNAFPDTEIYAEVITPFGQKFRFSPLIRSSEDILTQEQLNLVVAEGQLQIDRPIPALGGPARLLATYKNDVARPFVVVVGASLLSEKADRNNFLRSMAIGGPLFVGVLTLGGWLVAGAALRPVRRMTNEAAAISSADLSRRLPVERSTREVAHLGQTLNAMLDRLEGSFKRERTFVDDASHELRTPLAIMSGELELAILHPGNPDEQQATIRSVHEEVQRLSAMAADLLVLARAGEEHGARSERRIDLREVATATVERIRPTLRPEVCVRVIGDSATALMDDDRFERVVTNLVTNANRFCAGTIEVRVFEDHAILSDPSPQDKLNGSARSFGTTGSSAVLEVTDDGPGFTAVLLPHAFERFTMGDSARTRVGGGTGIGLAIVKALVEAQGGTVEAANHGTLGGAVVTVRLPS